MKKITTSINPREKHFQSNGDDVLRIYNIFTHRAAFQYGVKMSEGRKTRRFGGGSVSGKAKEKAKLDREWQQISAVRRLLLLGK